MDEKGLLELWNTKRTQIIKAQMAPNLMLIGIFVFEAEVLLTDLKRLDKPSELSKKIADSRHLLSLSAIAIVGLGIAVFALVVWAVLG
jgi:hypothetical protein